MSSNENNNQKYGLFTAITMITGIVIGSGIFFKSDNVLEYTNGNVLLGVVAFVIAAIAIIFGSLAISQLAMRTDKPGGIISYAEEFINPKAATAFGWFQTFLYFGTLIPVVGYVAGIYICSLFGIEATVYTTTGIGFLCFVVLFLSNMISARLGGTIQNAAMIIKLIPLIIIIVAGIIYGNPSTVFTNDVESLKTVGVSSSFFAAFVPLAFAFDGWIVSTSISHEIKDSKRNLPLALFIAPIFVLIIYVTYFVGITSIVGVDQVLALGDDAAYAAAELLFGATFSKIFLICIIVSVLGTLNGLTLGCIRMPYSLAVKNMFPGSKALSKTSDKFGGMPVNSAIFVFAMVVVATIIRFFAEMYLDIADISEVFVSISYLNFIFLYVVLFKLAKSGEIKSKFMGYFVPVMAIIGALIILYGALSAARGVFIVSLIISIIVIVSGYIYGVKK